MNDNNRERNGAILTVATEQRFKQVHLIWSKSRFYEFDEIGDYVRSQLEQRKLCEKVHITELKITDPTNHNEIYPKLLKFLNSVKKPGETYTAAISSGTPSMQACWILIAESAAFPLKLVRSDDPKFGVPVVRNVRLSAALPRIEKIRKENIELKRSALDRLEFNIKKPEVLIGNRILPLTPIEFAYYRFFAERALEGSEYLRFGIYETPKEFYENVLKFHGESFPFADGARQTLEKSKSISCSTFRSNVTRINKKIMTLVENPFYSNYYCIESEGQKFSKRYGISMPHELIKIR